MKLLLDTCAFLWLATKPVRLSKAAADAINDEANERFLSDVTLWEISLKHFVGKLPLPEPSRDWIPKRAQQVAADRNTTLDDLVQQYLKQLASATPAASDVAADRLLQTFRDLSRPLGGKPYQQRDELYDR